MSTIRVGDYVMVGRTVAVVTEVSYGYAVVRPALFSSIEREFPEEELRPATLGDVMREIVLSHKDTTDKNPEVDLDVVTSSVRDEFGVVYEGKMMQWGGVCGRAGDVPAYVAGEIVLDVEVKPVDFARGTVRYFITI